MSTSRRAYDQKRARLRRERQQRIARREAAAVLDGFGGRVVDFFCHACRRTTRTPSGSISRFSAQCCDCSDTLLAAAVSLSADFQEWPVIRLTCSTDFAVGRGRFLQLLDMSLSPCSP